jgi:chromate transporter
MILKKFKKKISMSTKNHCLNETDNSISFTKIFLTFFKVGLLTLGGGLAMTSVLRHELVLKRRWILDDDFFREISTATLVPGAIAVNLAYLQGRRLSGKPGAFFAVLGTVLPSFCIMLLIACFALPYFSHPVVAGFLKGCAIAVGGQLAFGSFIFIRKHLKKWQSWLICVFGLIVVAVLKMHPVWAVIVSGGLGFFLFSNVKVAWRKSKEK